jgi:1,4-alpha-glucan branching enzyme
MKKKPQMLLTKDELNSLVWLVHQSPHQLLGMHPLGDGSGVVARAFIPDAVSIEVRPTHEKDRPAFSLAKIHPDGVFEGVAKGVSQVYAYDLVITFTNGSTWQTRDPYSFLPTLGETDLYLFGQGTELRIYDKLGAHLRTIDGVAGASFAVWAPNAASALLPILIIGMDGGMRCVRSARRAFGKFLCRASRKGRITNSRFATSLETSR